MKYFKASSFILIIFAIFCFVSVRNAAAGGAVIQVGVDENTITGKISPTFVGLSFEKFTIQQSHRLDTTGSNLVNLIDTLGTNGTLRFGGTSMDSQTWYNSGGQTAPSWAQFTIQNSDISRLGDFSRATGWGVQYGINLLHFDSANASAESNYAKQSLGGNLQTFQCGNEPNLYANYTYSTFETNWEQCVSAVSQNGAMAGPDWANALPPQFIQDEKTRISYLTEHYYALSVCGGLQASLSDLLSDQTFTSENAKITQEVAKGAASGLKLYLDETNSVSCGGSSSVSNTYGAALWAVAYILSAAQDGAIGTNFHGGLNTCIADYSPICYSGRQTDADGYIYTPNPIYYGLLMAKLMGSGNFMQTSSDSTDIQAFSVKHADGSASMMLVNRDDPGSMVNVHISGINAGDAALTTMNGAALTSTSAENISVNGAQVGDNGKIAIPTGTKISRSGDGYDIQIPTGSAVMVQFSRKNTSTPRNTNNSDDKKVPGVPATGLAIIGLTGAVTLALLAVIFAKITKVRG